MENSLLPLPMESPSNLPIEGEIIGQKNCSVYPSLKVLCTSGLFCGTMNGQSTEGISLKQEIVDYCSLDLASAKPLTKCNIPKQKTDYAGVNRDLNIAIDTCDSSSYGSVMKHGQLHGLDLGGMQEVRLESCPVKWLTKKCKGTDVELEENVAHQSDFYCGLSNESVPTLRFDSDVHLDLQLKPPCRPEIRFDWGVAGDAGSSVEPNSISEMTKLSLALSGNPEVVKSELYEEGCQMGINIVEFHRLKSVDLRPANSEPCEGPLQDDDLKKDYSGHVRLSNTGVVQLEPHDGPSQEDLQENLQSLEVRCPRMKLDSGSLTSYCAEAPKDASERMVFDLNSDPIDYDGDTCHDGPEMHFVANIEMDANIQMDTDKAADECGHLASRALIPLANNLKQSVEVACGTSVPQYSNRIINEASRDLAEDWSAGCVISDCEESRVADCEPEVFVQTSSIVDDSNFSKSMADDLHLEFGINKTDESSGVEIDVSIDTLEQEVCDKKNESDHEVVSARDVTLENRGDDGHPEDDEVRDPTRLHCAVDGPWVADFERDSFAQIGSVGDDSNLSKSMSEDLHVELFGVSKPDESDGVEIDMSIDTLEHVELFGVSKPDGSDGVEIDMSIDTLEQEVCDKTNELDNSHEAVSARDFALEKRGDDSSFEDGEVRESTRSHGAVDGPVEKQVKQVHSELKNGLWSTRYNHHLCVDRSYRGSIMSFDVHESSVARSQRAGFSKNRYIKTTLKTKRNLFFDKTKGNDSVHKMSNFHRRDDGEKIAEGILDVLGRHPKNTINSDVPLSKHIMLSETGSASIGQSIKSESGTGWHGPINKLDSAPSRSWSAEKKGGPTRPMLSHKRNRLNDKSFKRNARSNVWRREERCLWEYECHRSQGKPVGEHDTNSTLVRKAENRSGALHCDSNSVPDNSTTWYPCPESAHKAHEIDIAVASDDPIGTAGMVAREPMMDGHYLSRISSPWPREVKIAAGARQNHEQKLMQDSVRNISPRRTGRERSDFHQTREHLSRISSPWPREVKIAAAAHQNHEQKLMQDSVKNISPSRTARERSDFHQTREHLSRISSRWPREVKMAAGAHQNHEQMQDYVKNISPSRTGREIYDFHQTHEHVMREFSDAIVDLSMPAQTQPHYERVGSTHIQRKRRLSPIPGSKLPTHSGDADRESSLGSRQCSLNQPLPSRRSSNPFAGHPDKCRSPLFCQSDRMQPARQHPQSAGITMVRKHDTSPVSRFRDYARNVSPSMAHESVRPFSVSHRNIHAAVEGHFGPTNDNYYEFSVGAEYGDSRCGERHELDHALRHHLDGSSGNEASHPDHVEDAHRIRFFQGVDGEFLNRGCVRNLGGHIKTRLGNGPSQQRGTEGIKSRLGSGPGQQSGTWGIKSRLRNGPGQQRGMEGIKSRLGNGPGQHRGTEVQEENFRYQHREGGYNSNFNNGWQKKRKTQPCASVVN